MNISLILAHPTLGSFNHALADTVRSALTAAGHTVAFHDLYAEQFDPVMRSEELARGAALPSHIEAYAAEMERAMGLVVVHPNWWSQPPAILKGWVDRVFRPGRAYNFVPDGKGGARSQGLLPLQRALVVTTANNPQDKEIEMYGDPLEVFWKTVVFRNLGVPLVERLVFAPVIASTPEQRRTWLDQTRATAARIFAEK
ncbi:MAG: NAD(P)H-dependent oxidoreductase [Verrucomicrobiota bacterium]